MAYCTNADVAGEFKNLTFSANTTPTATQVDGFITQADAFIDSKVGLRYAVPITPATYPISALTLKRLSTWLVAARVKEIIKVKTGDASTSQDARAGDMGKMARDELDQIAKGLQLLTDAPLKNSTEGLQGYGVSAGEALIFDKGTQQW